MSQKAAFLVIDIGTGNVRVALTSTTAEVIALERDNVQYHHDPVYADALYFDPEHLWSQIQTMCKRIIKANNGLTVTAITASSQREGIVLVDETGQPVIGMPNHDHRGREWEHIIKDADRVYTLTGRYPSSLFSAMKLVGVREKHPDLFARTAGMMSISDWAQYQFSGIQSYEHSQASETLLFDVKEMQWSDELLNVFSLYKSLLPPLRQSGTILGHILPHLAEELGISKDAKVIVGGADTQLAVKSTKPEHRDIVLVSGTTTPIVKIVDEYIVDPKQRSWTNRHTDKDAFILETNAGVTGLNLQRLKEIFYPNEGYDVMQKELDAEPGFQVTASLGSLVAEEKRPITRAGFHFAVPVSHALTRASFIKAAIWDIACSIYEDIECLNDISPDESDAMWICGGGFQSTVLRQFIADLTGKKLKFRKGFEQASVVGGALICSETMQVNTSADTDDVTVVDPVSNPDLQQAYHAWKKNRSLFKQHQQQEVTA